MSLKKCVEDTVCIAMSNDTLNSEYSVLSILYNVHIANIPILYNVLY